MVKKEYLVFVYILFFISFASSSTNVGISNMEKGKVVYTTPVSYGTTFTNTTVMNYSTYADIWITNDGNLDTIDTNTLNNNGGVLEIVQSWWDNLYCLLTGCTMTGQLNVDNDLNVTGKSYFEDNLNVKGNISLGNSINITTDESNPYIGEGFLWFQTNQEFVSFGVNGSFEFYANADGTGGTSYTPSLILDNRGLVSITSGSEHSPMSFLQVDMQDGVRIIKGDLNVTKGNINAHNNLSVSDKITTNDLNVTGQGIIGTMGICENSTDFIIGNLSGVTCT